MGQEPGALRRSRAIQFVATVLLATVLLGLALAAARQGNVRGAVASGLAGALLWLSPLVRLEARQPRPLALVSDADGPATLVPAAPVTLLRLIWLGLGAATFLGLAVFAVVVSIVDRDPDGIGVILIALAIAAVLWTRLGQQMRARRIPHRGLLLTPHGVRVRMGETADEEVVAWDQIVSVRDIVVRLGWFRVRWLLILERRGAQRPVEVDLESLAHPGGAIITLLDRYREHPDLRHELGTLKSLH